VLALEEESQGQDQSYLESQEVPGSLEPLQSLKSQAIRRLPGFLESQGAPGFLESQAGCSWLQLAGSLEKQGAPGFLDTLPHFYRLSAPRCSAS
jgi:hypothetical protein